MIKACEWLVWYPIYGWLVRGRFVDCLLGIVYVTLGLEDQGYCCLVLNNMLGGIYVIRC